MPAVQIITIEEDAGQFQLEEAALSEVLDKVPAGMKVSVVAVAGAFRTGKSFLLDLFLRYLRAEGGATAAAAGSDDWLLVNGQYLEGNENPFPSSVGGGGARTSPSAHLPACPTAALSDARLPRSGAGGLGPGLLVARRAGAEHDGDLAVVGAVRASAAGERGGGGGAPHGHAGHVRLPPHADAHRAPRLAPRCIPRSNNR